MKQKVFICIVLIFFSLSVFAQISGDANNDGVVNIVDSFFIAGYYVGLDFSINAIASDVNLDSIINITDALLVAQYYVGLIAELPINYTTPVPTPFIEFEPDTRKTNILLIDEVAREIPFDTATIRVYHSGCDSHFPRSGGSWGRVDYTVSGTATNGEDYKLLPGYVIFPEKDCFGSYPRIITDAPIENIIIEPIADDIIEGRESIIIQMGDHIFTLYIDD